MSMPPGVQNDDKRQRTGGAAVPPGYPGSANTWQQQEKDTSQVGYHNYNMPQNVVKNNTEPRRPYHKSVRMCKYGMGCTRSECWFQHPEGWSPELAIASVVEQTVILDQDDIPKIIGSGGGTIKQLCTQAGVKAHVNKQDDGRAMLDQNGKASITLHGPETGCTRFKAMVTAKIAESKLRAAGQWTEAMQQQQDDLIGARPNQTKPNGQGYQTAGMQQQAYMAMQQQGAQPAFAQAYQMGGQMGGMQQQQQQVVQYQQCFTEEGKEYYCNMTTRQTQWDKPPPGSRVIPGQRPHQPIAQTTSPAQEVKPGMLMGGQIQTVPFSEALAVSSHAIPTPQFPPHNSRPTIPAPQFPPQLAVQAKL